MTILFYPCVKAVGTPGGLMLRKLPVSYHKYISPWFGEVLIFKKSSNEVILLIYNVGVYIFCVVEGYLKSLASFNSPSVTTNSVPGNSPL